jgi:hypothetical protein
VHTLLIDLQVTTRRAEVRVIKEPLHVGHGVEPVSRSNLRDRRFPHALTHEGTVELSDVIVVCYQTPMVSVYPTDGRDESRKISHTWSRTATGWKIIGGVRPCGDICLNDRWHCDRRNLTAA